MQEFAANGYVSDEFNCFQYNNHSSVAPQSSQLPSQVPISSAGTGGNATAEGATFPSSLAAAHWINLSNYREHLNHVWRTMSMSYMPNVAANMGFAMPAASQNNINTMGLAVPPDHMRNVSNLNISNNKLNKRYNNGKFKELVSRWTSLRAKLYIIFLHFLHPIGA